MNSPWVRISVRWCISLVVKGVLSFAVDDDSFATNTINLITSPCYSLVSELKKVSAS